MCIAFCGTNPLIYSPFPGYWRAIKGIAFINLVHGGVLPQHFAHFQVVLSMATVLILAIQKTATVKLTVFKGSVTAVNKYFRNILEV